MAGLTRCITLPSQIRLQTTKEYMPEDPDDPLKPCPLVPAHIILSSRMALHLVKCREAQVLKVPLAQCKYDSTHWVPKKELVHHMTEECDKREIFDRYVVNLNDCSPTDAPCQPPELPEFEEDWDDGPMVSYDPTLKAESEAVLRTQPVTSKKERKRFRNSERRRLQELEREGKVLSGTSVSCHQAKPPAELRKPHKTVHDQIPQPKPSLEEKNPPLSATGGSATMAAANQPATQPKACQSEEKSKPLSSPVGSAPSEIVHSLEQLNLEGSTTKKDNAWVSVGKGGRKAGKKN